MLDHVYGQNFTPNRLYFASCLFMEMITVIFPYDEYVRSCAWKSLNIKCIVEGRKKMQLLTSYSNLNNKMWKRHPGFPSLTLARFNSRADLFLKQILLKSNWWLHRERFSPCHNLARAENPSPVCHTMMYLENRSPVCYTGLGISARANVLKNLKKSHIIDTEFRPGLKN